MNQAETIAHAQELGAINAKLEVEATHRTFWHKFTGFAKPKTPSHEEYILPGNPIVVIEGSAKIGNQGSRLINTPMMRQLPGYGVAGKQQLKGREKTPITMWKQQAVHLLRYAISLPHLADVVDVKWLGVYEQHLPLVRDWWSSYYDHDIPRTFLEGNSKHITDPADVNAEGGGGLGWPKMYNKNFFVWDGTNKDFDTNSPTFNFVSATYKAAIITKLASLGTSDKFCYDAVVTAGEAAMRNKVEPYNVGGEDVYIMVINSKQELQLRTDQQWITMQSQSRLPDNPIFKNALGRISNVIMFVNNNTARIAYATGTTLEFFDYSAGVDNSANDQYKNPQTAGTNQHAACAILFGANAINKAMPVIIDPHAESPVASIGGLKFSRDTEDYGAIKGLATAQTFSFSRPDFYDVPLAGATVPTSQISPNSAIVVTYV